MELIYLVYMTVISELESLKKGFNGFYGIKSKKAFFFKSLYFNRDYIDTDRENKMMMERYNEKLSQQQNKDVTFESMDDYVEKM